MEAEGRESSVGLRSVGVPGTLAAWCEMLARFGTLDLPTVVAPAIRHAESGFRVTGYLAECIAETAADLARFEETARVFLPGGAPPGRGDRLVQPEYAGTLRTIAAEGPGALYGGALGRRVVEHMRRAGGLITLDDLRRRARPSPRELPQLRGRRLPAADGRRDPPDPDPESPGGL